MACKKEVNQPERLSGSLYMRKPDELKHDPKEGEEEVKETEATATEAEVSEAEPVAAE